MQNQSGVKRQDPHSIANAVVHEAKMRELHHEERHTTVEYVVAHGITSMIDGQRASIGSYHFIFEDEMTEIAEEDRPAFANLPDEYSLLYLALDGRLAAVICISDPLRENAGDVIEKLHRAGFKNIVMMSGDSEKTAAYIAAGAGVDHYIAEVLPEEKAEYIRMQRLDGPYKEVFSLRTFSELSFKEIGKEFGKSDNWARVIYHRAKMKIKEEMKDE